MLFHVLFNFLCWLVDEWTSGYLSFDFGSFWFFGALICAIYELFTPKVEVSDTP